MRIHIEFYAPDDLDMELTPIQAILYQRWQDAGGITWTSEWHEFYDSITPELSEHMLDSRNVDSVEQV